MSAMHWQRKQASFIRKYEHLQRCMQAASPTYQAEAAVETESDTEFLPDRLINTEEYEPPQKNTVLLSPQKTWGSQ